MPTSSLADVEPSQADVVAVTDHDEQLAAPGIPRHPVVMVAVVGLPLLAVAVYGLEPQAAVAAVTAVALVVLAAIDLEHRLLPNRILLPAIGIVLALQLAFFSDRALEWVLAGLAAAAFLALPLVVRRDAMGMGDIKLAVLLGVATGWAVFGAIVIGCLSMLPVALWMLRRDGSIRNATLPFGPFLAFGALVVVFTA
jgi:leader peptidase (prepilin peptidase)/N-methyltransferase